MLTDEMFLDSALRRKADKLLEEEGKKEMCDLEFRRARSEVFAAMAVIRRQYGYIANEQLYMAKLMAEDVSRQRHRRSIRPIVQGLHFGVIE